jgi:Holliday junction resolvasome RuvABC ATP-dependent DNA helicase subunit
MTKQEKIQVLNEYKFPYKLQRALLPLCEDDSQGLCLAFIGNEGTNKRSYTNKIAKFLFRIGLIDKWKWNDANKGYEKTDGDDGILCYRTSLVDDKFFRDRMLYEIVNVQYHKDKIAADKKRNSIEARALTGENMGVNALDLFCNEFKYKYFILNCNKKEFDYLKSLNPRISFIFSAVVEFGDWSSDEMMFACLKELPDGIIKKITDENKQEAKGYFEKYNGKLPFCNRELSLYVSNHIKQNGRFVLPPAVMDVRSMEELLSPLIGMDTVKDSLYRLRDYVTFQKKAKDNGIKLPNQHLHMVFTGNPGTGKTTIARIVAECLYSVGLLRENKVIEAERKDLVAEYVGQTAPKTDEVIKRAMGGVLFIDEAYSLVPEDGSRDYGAEAIATLITAMENHSDELVVIFAGYNKEMARFVDSNPGISSRIGYTFKFEDYKPAEIDQILKIKLKDFSFTDDADVQIMKDIEFFSKAENFGNGRFADRLAQEIIIKHARNSEGELTKIVASDVPTVEELSDIIFSAQRYVLPEMLTDEDYKRTCYHELGHAVARYKLFGDANILKITISPSADGTLGYVVHKNSDMSVSMTRDKLEKECMCLYAGAAAEEVFLGEKNQSTGCWSDLQKAQYLLESSLFRGGFSKTAGKLYIEHSALNEDHYKELGAVSSEIYEKSVAFIKENMDMIEQISDNLLIRKTMTGDEIGGMFAEYEKAGIL